MSTIKACPIGRCDGTGWRNVITDPATGQSDADACEHTLVPDVDPADTVTCPECGQQVDPHADDTERAHWDSFHPDCYVDHLNGPCPEHDRS